jgi:hypothetical protein
MLYGTNNHKISNCQYLISNERRRHFEIFTLDILLEIRNWILEINNRKNMKMNKKIVIPFALTTIALCSLSFYAGMQFAGGQNTDKRAQFAGQFGDMPNGAKTGTNVQRMRGGGMGMVSGEILSKDEKSITVKDRTGGSKIVFLGASTEVMKSAVGTLDDLAIGTDVITNGTPNADGSITATTVQIRPESQGFGTPGGIPTGTPKAQ